MIVQKDTLLKEVNHRVQNSIQLIISFLALQAKAENDDALTRHLTDAQRRLTAVALVHRRLYSDDNVESVDLSRYFGELLNELKASMGKEWNGLLSFDLAPITVPADSAVQAGLILVELVINAQKYAYLGAPGPINISLDQHRARFHLVVADHEQGRIGSRRGFGSRMMDAMVKSLSANVDELDNNPGLRIVLSAPIILQAAQVDQEVL